MLKLPLCPHCGARFLYPDVKKLMRAGSGTCPHCGKTFRTAGKPQRAVLFAAAALVMIFANYLLLEIPSMNLLFLTVTTAAGVVVTWLLIPFTARLK